MRQKGLFFRTVESENDKLQVQAYIGEIGDAITDIQLGLLVAVRSHLTVCTPSVSEGDRFQLIHRSHSQEIGGPISQSYIYI